MAQQFERFKPSELKGFRVWDYGSIGLSESKKPGNVVRKFHIVVDNFTRYEVAEVDVRLHVTSKIDGKDVYLSPKFTLNKIAHGGVLAHRGSVLPGNSVIELGAFSVDYSGMYWRTDTVDKVEIVEIRAFKGPQDLKQVHHLYSKLFNCSDEEALAIFKKDPSLCKVTNEFGFSATLAAFATCPPKVIEYVVANGGSWNAVDKSGATIMEYAVMNDKPATMELAVKHGGNVNHSYTMTPLYLSVFRGNLESTKWLLSHGAKADLETKGGTRPLSAAIYRGMKPMVDLLVKAGANPKKLSRDGYSLMHEAVRNNSMFDTLAKYGVPVDQRNPKNGMTPLIFAVYTSNYGALPWLLSHGADPYAKDKDGHDGFYYSKLTNTLKTDRFFREYVDKYSKKRK